MFDLKSPCENCPFRKGCGSLFRLNRLRLAEIKGGAGFQCHKTVDYNNGPEDENGFTIPQPGAKPQQCAGLMSILIRDRDLNQMMQIASRLNILDLDAVDPRREAYDSWRQAARAHLEGAEPVGKFRRKPRRRPLPDTD